VSADGIKTACKTIESTPVVGSKSGAWRSAASRIEIGIMPEVLDRVSGSPAVEKAVALDQPLCGKPRRCTEDVGVQRSPTITTALVRCAGLMRSRAKDQRFAGEWACRKEHRLHFRWLSPAECA